MTTNEALPQRAQKRTTPDRVRRANLAGGAVAEPDGFMPLEWLKDTGASITEALMAWDRGELAELPVGAKWDVVRMERRRGWRTVTALRTAGATVGPVLHSESHVDVLVPAGSAADWDQDGATVLGDGEVLRAPHPAVIAPHTQHARSWIEPPNGANLTDGTALYEAYAAAGASMALEGIR
jgi:hypothetical protein